MPLPLDRAALAESTRELKEKIDQQRLSPRVRMALRMYAYGGVDTLSQAAEACGLNNAYLGLVMNSKPGQEFMESAEKILADKALDGAMLLDKLGRRALEVTAKIMENGLKEENQLRAAIDLSDRSPTFSKVQKHQVEAITLGGRDVERLAEALARGRDVHETFAHLATENYNRISDGNTRSESPPTDSERPD